MCERTRYSFSNTLFFQLKTKDVIKVFVLTLQYNIWLCFKGMTMILKSFNFIETDRKDSLW